jgi:hypothetical protein
MPIRTVVFLGCSHGHAAPPRGAWAFTLTAARPADLQLRLSGSLIGDPDPSATAALPGIVPDGQLEQAWAATEARTYSASLAGPVLGGVLFGLGRAVPFLADAVSYGVSFGTVSRIRGRFRSDKTIERKALWREVTDGLRLVWRVPILRATVIQSPLINFAFNGVIFTVILAMRQHGTSTAVIGLAQAAIGAGGLLGAIAAPRLQGRMRLGTLIAIISLAGALLLGAAALLIPSPLVAAPLATARVSNTMGMVAMALAALAPLIAGLLVQHVSGGWATGAFAATMAFAAALCLLLPGFRKAEFTPRRPASR